MKAMTPKAIFIMMLLLCSSQLATAQHTFEPTIPSLKHYECPEWFSDAKFGIYIHWGIYSIPEFGEWYAHEMYREGTESYNYHVEKYGHPSKFGYKDFIPMWKAEKFDADQMVATFKKAGAKYFTPCAVHHDGFDLWDSKHTRWNSVNMGPKRDIIGEFRAASIKQGLHFGVTTHLARTLSWMQTSHGADKKGEKAGVAYDGANPEFQDFYMKPNRTSRYEALDVEEDWAEMWYKRLADLIDQHRPELIYLDSGIPFLADDGKIGMKLMSYFYNRNTEWHGEHHGVFNIKDRGPRRSLYVDGVSTLDLERSKAGQTIKDPWQTDDSIGPWGYRKGAEYKSVNCVIDKLVDIVSKNGNLLLNVPPKADGSLDAETLDVLKGIGDWLDINGDAIYTTRPWFVYGEGPRREMGHMDRTSPYDAKNIRFTRSKYGKKLNVIVLGWPDKDLTLKQIIVEESEGATIELLGHKEPIKYSVDPDGALTLKIPNLKVEDRPCKHAYSFQLTGFKLTAPEPWNMDQKNIPPVPEAPILTP